MLYFCFPKLKNGQSKPSTAGDFDSSSAICDYDKIFFNSIRLLLFGTIILISLSIDSSNMSINCVKYVCMFESEAPV